MLFLFQLAIILKTTNFQFIVYHIEIDINATNPMIRKVNLLH